MSREKYIGCKGSCGMEYTKKFLTNGFCDDCLKKIAEEEKRALSELKELKRIMESDDFLLANDDIDGKIKCITKISVAFPKEPHKPYLKPNATSVEARKYADELEAYEKEMEVYKVEKEKYDEANAKAKRLFAKWAISELLPENLPEWQKSKIYAKARSNASGYFEAYQELQQLAELFSE
jgi:cell fate (sporulation/competence/biofilm development) regulator YlbF (YheA/YmcA/DUF963 family)